MKAMVPARGCLNLNITSCRFSCFIVKQKTKTRHIHSLSAPLGLNFSLLSGQVWAGTRGPHSTTTEAFKLHNDSLHLKLTLW